MPAPRSTSGGGALAGPPLELGPDEPVQVAVEHRLRVADLLARAEVLHHRVRVDDVGADLAPEADRLAVAAGARGFRLAPLELLLDQAGAQHREGRRPVLHLRAL